jgi:hypothetical protein
MKHIPIAGMQIFRAVRAIHPKRSTLQERLKRNPIATGCRSRPTVRLSIAAVELALVPPKGNRRSVFRSRSRGATFEPLLVDYRILDYSGEAHGITCRGYQLGDIRQAIRTSDYARTPFDTPRRIKTNRNV